MKEIAVAVVGVGGMGRTHIENLRAMDDVVITDICDKSDNARQLADELCADFYTSYEELLDNTQAQAVLICTPTFMHYEQVKAVLSHKKYCICEKPLCLHSARAKELYGLANQNDVFLYVGQVVHFFDEYELAEQFIREGRYGSLLDAYFCRLTEQPNWTSGGWFFDCQKSGLIPYDLHIHELDFIVSLFGPPKNVTIQKGRADENQSYYNYYRFLYDYDSPTVCAEASWYNSPIPFTQSFRLYFQKAMLICDEKGLTLYEREKPPVNLTEREKQGCVSTMINVMPTNAYHKELVHFLSCIREHVPSGRVGESQVVSVLETLEQIEDLY